MRDGLVPKVIVDRRGRKTTRWVRPIAAGAASMPPAPQVPTSHLDDPFEASSPLLSSLINEAAAWPDLARCDRALLDVLDREMLSADNDLSHIGAVRRHCLAGVAEEALQMLRRHRDPSMLHCLALCCDQIGTTPQAHPNDFRETINGLWHHGPEAPSSLSPFTGVLDYTDLPPERIDQLRAVVYATSALDRDLVSIQGGNPNSRGADPERRVIRSDGLAALIMERPGRVHEVVEIANATNGNADVIRARLDHPEQALRDGVL